MPTQPSSRHSGRDLRCWLGARGFGISCYFQQFSIRGGKGGGYAKESFFKACKGAEPGRRVVV
eukprot:3836912-Rhodomonas_salina.4